MEATLAEMIEKIIDLNPFREALLRRRASQSLVTIFKTRDPHRLPAFIKFILDHYPVRPRILIYWDFRGLEEFIEFTNDGIRTEPITANASSAGGLSQLAGQRRIRDLGAVLSTLESMLRAPCGGDECVPIVAIFWNPLLSQQEALLFSKFLNSVIYDYTLYPKRHWIVIFTENPERVVDERIMEDSIVIDMLPSLIKERVELLKLLASDVGIDASPARIEQVASVTEGFNLHRTETVALLSILKRKDIDIDVVLTEKQEFAIKVAGGVLEVVMPRHGFEAVGGYDVVKKFIRERIVKVLKNPEKARKYGIEPPRGILFFGPPGTGKTWIARAMAKELGILFMKTSAGHLKTKWYGETARNVKRLRDIAEAAAPAVLFIDEIDQLATSRNTLIHEETRSALGVLLEWLGDPDRKTIIVAATNKPEDLDEALIRAGRFDYIIPILYPDRVARREILEVHVRLRRLPLAEDVNLDAIAAKTEFWTGAELEKLVKNAAFLAFEEEAEVVEQRHFERALRKTKVNVAKHQELLQRYLKLAEEFTTDEEFLEALKAMYSGGSRAHRSLSW